MLALGYEDENLYSTLRDGEAVRRFFDERAIAWWRHCRFEDVEMNCPTRNMASSQIACVNFVLPLGGTEDGLLAMLAAIDDDVTGIVPIEDPAAGTSSPVEFEWIGLGHAREGKAETRRGKYSTSVDVFVVAETRKGRRAYLLEWKYTESYDQNDMGQGTKGKTRRRRYGKPYAASPAFRDGIPLDAWLHEPFFQIRRQQLLADRMVEWKELGVDEAKVVLEVPDGNADYQQNVTSPSLRNAFPEASTVEKVTREAMNHPDRNFAVMSQQELGVVVRARCGDAVRDWTEYNFDRYGW